MDKEQTNKKKWYESKTVLLAILMTLIGVSDFLYDTFSASEFQWQNIFIIVGFGKLSVFSTVSILTMVRNPSCVRDRSVKTYPR